MVEVAGQVSMHLLVLSAFRLWAIVVGVTVFTVSQCTFWCSVLSDRITVEQLRAMPKASQCTFWCSVLSDNWSTEEGGNRLLVSMHLLVLSAFRHSGALPKAVLTGSLNAPSGAQCFPTQDS